MVVRKDISNIIAKASKLDESKMGYLTPKEWKKRKLKDGAKRFKKETVGYFSNKTIKSVDEMAEILYSTDIVSSTQEGKELLPELVPGRAQYDSFPFDKLTIEEVQDSKGEVKYKTEFSIITIQ